MKTIRFILMMAVLCISQNAMSQETKTGSEMTEEQREALEARLNSVRAEMQGIRTTLDEQLDSLADLMKDLKMKPAPDTTRKNDRVSVSISDQGMQLNFGNESGKGDKQKKEELKNFQTEWLLLDLGINPYLHENSFNMPDSGGAAGLDLNYSRSVHVGLHLFQQAMRLGTDKLWLRYGLSVDYRNYSFQDDIVLIPDSSRFAFMGSEVPLKKSKLTTQSFLVPLMLQFENNAEERGKSFRLIVGGYGGYTFRIYSKSVNEDNHKTKLVDNFNVQQIRYGVTARLGLSKFTLYANYDMSPLFEEGRGPELYPVTAGIVLHGFSFN
ncbi:MAG: outer membrane beta-barrel protein [Bacteroidia bacterium]